MNLNILKNSSLRRERKKESIKERLYKKISKNLESGCWEWLGYKTKFGHGKIGFRDKVYLTHRISFEIHNKEIPENINVCHKCDNPSCVNPEHLFLGSQNDNMLDAYRKGRLLNPPKMIGEKNPFSKFKNSEIINIRKRLESGEKGINIAKEYNVSKTIISKIKLNKSYKNI